MRYMRTIGAFLALAFLTVAGATPGQASNDMLARMAALNPKLHSYEATIHVDIALHTFPYLSPSLNGMYYHKEPSKDKLTFDTVPAIAAQFNKIYPRIESPSRWTKTFFITNQGDDGTLTTFKLVPRVHSRVDHITAKVDDKTATISQLEWTYTDGGFARMNQTFTTINGNYIAKSQTGHVEVPHYTADLSSTFSNFKLNPPLPDSVFKQN